MIKTLPVVTNGHAIPQESEITVLHLAGEEVKILSAGYNCAVCDRLPAFRVGEDAVHAEDPCPYPDGITTTITLAVPSGKMLVTDDLRPVYDWDDGTFASYNSALGQAQVIQAMADAGCAYGPVGNSCPGLYRTGPDSYIIARPEYDEDENPSLPESDLLASVTTDLWAYSIADFEHWKSRGGNPEALGWSDTVVDVRPGTYRFVHHSGERGFDRDAAGTAIFAHVERVA